MKNETLEISTIQQGPIRIVLCCWGMGHTTGENGLNYMEAWSHHGKKVP